MPEMPRIVRSWGHIHLLTEPLGNIRAGQTTGKQLHIAGLSSHCTKTKNMPFLNVQIHKFLFPGCCRPEPAQGQWEVLGLKAISLHSGITLPPLGVPFYSPE